MKRLRFVATAAVSVALAAGVSVSANAATLSPVGTFSSGYGAVRIQSGVNLNQAITLDTQQKVKAKTVGGRLLLQKVPGTVLTGRQAVRQRAKASGFNAVYSYGAGPTWSREYKWLSGSFWGTKRTSVKPYGWAVAPVFNGGMTCAQGYGYRIGGGGYWSYMGCSQDGSYNVQWSNAIGIPKFKAMTIRGLYTFGYWW